MRSFRTYPLFCIQLGSGTNVLLRNATGHVVGYAGYIYEQLHWISLFLNFRYLLYDNYNFFHGTLHANFPIIVLNYNTVYIYVFLYVNN